MTNSVSEILGSDLLFVIGSNTTEAHPIIGNKMKQAVRKGTRLIVIDPRTTELAGLADLHLPLHSGSDIALINGLIHIILEEGWEDRAYIEERTEDFEALAKSVRDYTPSKVSAITGIDEGTLRETARLYAQTRKAGIYYTLGITEHTTGTANVMSLANLALVTGHIGYEHAGINPLRGQNNVQGACDVGALPNTFPGYQPVTDQKNIDYFTQLWGRAGNGRDGLRIPEIMDGGHEGTVRALYVMGEDPVLSDPDANHVRAAIEKMEFVAVQEIFMSETAKLADVIFPAACYAEKEGSFTCSERRVQLVRKAVDPPGEARADWRIICDLAQAMGVPGFFFNKAEEVFEELRLATPLYRGMTYERLDKENGLQWPCPTSSHPGTKFLHKGVFPRGRARFVPVDYEPPTETVSEDYPFLLTTGRKLGHYNVTSRFSKLLESINPFEEAEINPEDARALGLVTHDLVRVSSRRGSVLTRVLVTDRVKPGLLFMTFHFLETPTNVLTRSAFDPVTLTGAYKISAVRVEKASQEEIQAFTA